MTTTENNTDAATIGQISVSQDLVRNLTGELINIYAQSPFGDVHGLLVDGNGRTYSRFTLVGSTHPRSYAYATHYYRGGNPVSVDGVEVPVATLAYDVIHNLPDPVDGYSYIVSQSVADAARFIRRKVSDLFVPGRAVLDLNGDYLGVTEFSRV